MRSRGFFIIYLTPKVFISNCSYFNIHSLIGLPSLKTAKDQMQFNNGNVKQLPNIVVYKKIWRPATILKTGRNRKAIWVGGKKSTMFNRFTIADKLLFLAALLSLIFSEALWFSGDQHHAIFVGLWVPTILCFGIYLKLLKHN